jgi:hypothetical protein
MNIPTNNPQLPHTALPQSQAGNSRHKCSCGASFTQWQGLTRHIRTALNPTSCAIVSCDFKSARPYAHREHILKRHPELNPDEVLGKRGSRRPATPLTKRSAQQPRPLLAVERGQQTSARFQPYPLALPSVVGVTGVSQRATSVDNLQPMHPEPAITMHEHDFRDAPDLPAMLPSIEERPELARDLDDSLQDRQLGLAKTFFPRAIFDFIHAVRLPSTHLDQGGSTAAHGLSNPETPIPTPALPASESVMWEEFFLEFYTF